MSKNENKYTSKKKAQPQLTEEDLMIQEDSVEETAIEKDNSFIVRNILEGYHCVSDLNLTFGPLQVMDLTTTDADLVKRSKDLRASLKMGMLVRITRKQWEEIEERDYQREKAKVYARQQKEQERKRIQAEAGNREFEAEEIDLDKSYGKHDEEVSTAGYHNDPLTYATAFNAAKAEAEAQGRTLDAEQFANMVKDNPTIIKSIIGGNRGVTSGVSRRGRATVLRPPVNDGEYASFEQVNMSNYNRDHYVAGGEDIFSDMGSGYAEEIDLALDGEDY